MQWTRTLLDRDFRPAAAALLTGYSQTLHRKWIERHFEGRDGLRSSGDRHRWLGWVGVQTLTVFGDVMAELGSAGEALAAVRPAGLSDTTRPAVSIFEQDHRDRTGTREVYLVRDFTRHREPLFTLSIWENLTPRPRLYLYSLSRMQQMLTDRLDAYEL